VFLLNSIADNHIARLLATLFANKVILTSDPSFSWLAAAVTFSESNSIVLFWGTTHGDQVLNG
jgi:hypothetical protein